MRMKMMTRSLRYERKNKDNGPRSCGGYSDIEDGNRTAVGGRSNTLRTVTTAAPAPTSTSEMPTHHEDYSEQFYLSNTMVCGRQQRRVAGIVKQKACS